MSTYVDGFVLSIPKKNTAAYKKMATEAARVWKKFGALEYKECMIDDKKPDPSMSFTFEKMVKPKKNEVIWFSYIVYKSRAHRDAVNKKVMAYFDEKYKGKKMPPMPFDMNRMVYAGFKPVVEA